MFPKSSEQGLLAFGVAPGKKPFIETQSDGVESPPITTPIACCDAVFEYIRDCSDAEVVVAEGCRDPHMKTHEVFIELGYADWAVERGLHLIDLNDVPLEWRENADCEMFSQISLPEIAFTHYIISVPVLKAHPLATLDLI